MKYWSLVVLIAIMIAGLLLLPHLMTGHSISHDKTHREDEIESLNREIEVLKFKLESTDELLSSTINVVIKQRECECNGE